MTNLAKKYALILTMAMSFSAFAIMDTKSSNYSRSETDIKVPGIGYDLRVTRTYNSRSLYEGMFGSGWCTDPETKLEVTPESYLKITECGGGMEVLYMPKNFKADRMRETVKLIMTEVRARRPDLRPDYLATLEKDLRTNDFMREEFSRRMNIRGKVQDGVVYMANGREAENITLKSGVYKRAMADGTFQTFDGVSGRILSMSDRNQNFLKMAWEKDQLTSITDNQGRKLTFKYYAANKKVSEIVGPNGMTAKYVYKGDDLVEAVNSSKEKFRYDYDDVHNLVKVEFPDKSFIALTYNKDKDWVTSFRNQKGCMENYDYFMDKEDPQNHFWTTVVKKCGERITNQSKYEFFHRPKPDSEGVYLYRVRTEVNNNVTDIVYHENLGKPLSILKDNVRTDYTYFDNGFVKTKKEPGRMLTFEYKNACTKVSRLVAQFYGSPAPAIASAKDKPRKPSAAAAAAQAEKVVKTLVTQFTYDNQKCNLQMAENSDGQMAKLRYDAQGRIEQIEDQSKKLVKIRYENKFGKPWVVTRPGLGAIQVTYKVDGEIDKVESKEGPNVAVQVASIFNNLLEMIGPATSEAPL